MESVDEPLVTAKERSSIVRSALILLIGVGAALSFYALFKVASVLAGFRFP